MSSLSPSQLQRALAKSPPRGAYYLAGSEGILKDEALALLLDRALDPGLRDFNLDYLSAAQLDPDGLASACSTLPMMSDVRVVVVRDIEAWKRKSKGKEPAVQYLQKPAPETVLIFVQGNDDDADAALAQHCTLISCDALTGDALETWLTTHLEDAGVALEDDAREHLLRATGSDLGILRSEIAKLSSLEVTGPIDREMVGGLVGIRYGETIDDWRDAVLQDDAGRALEVLPRVLALSGVSGVKLVTMLGTSLLILRWGRATAEAKKIKGRALAEQVKSYCFRARPGVGSYPPFAALVGQVVGRWSLPRLRTAIAATLAADAALKSTTISDEGGIVTDLVLQLATSRARKAA